VFASRNVALRSCEPPSDPPWLPTIACAPTPTPLQNRPLSRPQHLSFQRMTVSRSPQPCLPLGSASCRPSRTWSSGIDCLFPLHSHKNPPPNPLPTTPFSAAPASDQTQFHCTCSCCCKCPRSDPKGDCPGENDYLDPQPGRQDIYPDCRGRKRYPPQGGAPQLGAPRPRPPRQGTAYPSPCTPSLERVASLPHLQCKEHAKL
jgi:hypothetical protein